MLAEHLKTACLPVLPKSRLLQGRDNLSGLWKPQTSFSSKANCGYLRGTGRSASPLKKHAKFPAADDCPPYWDYRRVATGESDNSVLCRYVKKDKRTHSRDHRDASSSSLAADQKLQKVSLPDHQDKVHQTLLQGKPSSSSHVCSTCGLCSCTSKAAPLLAFLHNCTVLINPEVTAEKSVPS